MNNQVTEYINQASEQQKKIMEIVRQLIHENVGQVQEEFKWSRPVFKKTRDFVYFKTAKAYVTIGFFNYQKLNDPGNLLEGTGQDMRHIKLKSADAMNIDLLRDWIISAAE
jgi:hypothetical protein